MLAALAGAALVAAAVAVGVIALTGGSHHTTPTASTTTAKAVKQLARLPLTSPDRTSKAVGLGEIVQQGSVKGIILAAAAIGWIASSGGFERSGNKRPTVSVAVNDGITHVKSTPWPANSTRAVSVSEMTAALLAA